MRVEVDMGKLYWIVCSCVNVRCIILDERLIQMVFANFRNLNEITFVYYNQYLHQLWAGGGLKNRVNSAQTGNLLKDFGK
jgi:hypothetical protein